MQENMYLLKQTNLRIFYFLFLPSKQPLCYAEATTAHKSVFFVF